MSFRDWLSDKLIDAACWSPRLRKKLVLAAIIVAGGIAGGHDTVTPINVSNVTDNVGSSLSDTTSARFRIRVSISEDQGSNFADDVSVILRQKAPFVDNYNSVTDLPICTPITPVVPLSYSNLSDSVIEAGLDGVLENFRAQLKDLGAFSDSVTQSDTFLALERHRAEVSDSVVLSDSAQAAGRLLQSLSDSQDLTDSASAFVRLFASVSDDQGSSYAESIYPYVKHHAWQESVTYELKSMGGNPVNANISDEMGVLECITLWDEVSISLAAGGTTPLPYPFADDQGVNWSDSVSVLLRHRAIADDAGTPDDIVGKDLRHWLPLWYSFPDEEGLQLSDSAAALLKHRASASDDANTLSDIGQESRPVVGGATPINVSTIADDQGSSWSDSTAALLKEQAGASDSQSPTDSFSALSRQPAQPSDSLSLSDTLTGLLKGRAVASESEPPADSLQAWLRQRAQASETVPLEDVASASTIGLSPVTANVSDDQGANWSESLYPYVKHHAWQESVQTVVVLRVRPNDSQALADQVDVADNRKLAQPFDSLSITDSAPQIELHSTSVTTGTPTDTVSLAEPDLTLLGVYETQVEDSLAQTDLASARIVAPASFFDSQGTNWSDQTAALLRELAQLSDQLSVTDTVNALGPPSVGGVTVSSPLGVNVGLPSKPPGIISVGF